MPIFLSRRLILLAFSQNFNSYSEDLIQFKHRNKTKILEIAIWIKKNWPLSSAVKCPSNLSLEVVISSQS